MKKVGKVRWHSVLRETLNAQASNFVLDPRFNWKPVECSHMPVRKETASLLAASVERKGLILHNLRN